MRTLSNIQGKYYVLNFEPATPGGVKIPDKSNNLYFRVNLRKRFV